MIGNEQTLQEVENLENSTEEILDRKAQLVENLGETLRILEDTKNFKKSDVYLLMQSDMNELYQTAFAEAMNESDAHKSKFALERMKGIGLATKVIDNLIIRLEDDAKQIGNALEEEK